MTATKMKAAIYTEYGAPEVLHLAEVEKPTPKENDILIRVQARNINFGDLVARNFANLPLRKFHMPSILFVIARLSFGWRKPRVSVLGSEFSGVVDTVGANVTNFKPGNKVYGYLGQTMGANAEYVCMSADGTVTQMPENMSFAEAAAVPYGAVTAINLLKRVNIQPGHKVLINGASGSIGAAALQLAKHYGAEVTAVGGTARQGYMQALGADHVMDYTREDFTKSGETYDLILDVLGKSTFAGSKQSLTSNGRYLRASFKMREVFQALWTSRSNGKRVIVALATDQQEDLVLIRELVEAGKYSAIVDRCFPLEQAAEAHRYAESGNKTGSVIIVTDAAAGSTQS